METEPLPSDFEDGLGEDCLTWLAGQHEQSADDDEEEITHPIATALVDGFNAEARPIADYFTPIREHLVWCAITEALSRAGMESIILMAAIVHPRVLFLIFSLGWWMRGEKERVVDKL